MSKLTDVQLREWMRTGKRIAGKSDGRGLTFTLASSGTATWTLRYRFAGKPREMTVGRYPDLSLKVARVRAAEARAQLAAGIDVGLAKRRAKVARAAVRSFRELADDYLERVAPQLSASTQHETRRYLAKDILPRIGHLKVSDVTPADVVYVIEHVAKRSATVARRAFEILSVIFTHGVAKQVVAQNPCAALKPAAIIGVRRNRRERVKLSTEQIRALLAGLPRLGAENALAVKILLATCVRKSELIQARLAHVDLDRQLWTIPDEHSKTGKGFVIPLAPTVARWFEALLALAGDSEYVLPSRARRYSATERTINRSTLNAALARLDSDLPHFTPHDLRSTARSHLAALGVDVIVAERCLNHSLGGLVAVYDQHDYLEERRAALEKWAELIESAERPSKSAVVPLRKSA